MTYKKVGTLDGYTMLRNQDDILYKVVPGEIESEDLWSEPLDCLLLVKVDNDEPQDIRIAQDIRIGGLDKRDLPDRFDFEFKGNKGESYSGQLGWQG